MVSDKKDLFRVIYDLSLSPVTYDFGHYLAHAEAVRQLTHKNSLIDLTIRADGFRSHTPRDKTMKEDEKWWRIKSIIIGCCSILNTISDIKILKDYTREDEQEYDFPSNYQERFYGKDKEISEDNLKYLKSLYRPSQFIELYENGANFKVFKGSKHATRQIKLGLQDDYIVMTIRCSKYFAERNIDIGEWFKFYQFLVAEGHVVVVVPDQEDCFRSREYTKVPWVVFEPAAFDIDLRIALCCGAKLNFVSSHGPSSLLYFTKAKFLQFDLLRGGIYGQGFWEKHNGFPIGGNYPWLGQNQRLVWEDSSFETLKKEYLKAAKNF